MHVAAGADRADAMAAHALRPAEVVPAAQLSAHERGLVVAEAEAPALAGLADVAHKQNRYADAHRLLTESLALFRELDDAPWTAQALTDLGNAELFALRNADRLRFVKERRQWLVSRPDCLSRRTVKDPPACVLPLPRAGSICGSKGDCLTPSARRTRERSEKIAS